MTIKAEFEEKQYESAANVELARDGRMFTPGQVEEGVLGYDVAAQPGDEVTELLERVAKVRLGEGIWLTPNWWLRCPARPKPSSARSRFASLLLQYKRPTWHISPGSPAFAAHEGAYFRIGFRASQHQTLVRLDEALNDAAIVRYAAPSTIHRTTLEQWQIDERILENSNFVSPRRIGLKHRGWTYTEPGCSGFRNEFIADEDPLPSETLSQLLGTLAESPAAAGLDRHLRALTLAVGGPDLEERAVAAVQELGALEVDLPGELDLLNLLRLRLVGLSLIESDTAWWLVEMDGEHG